MALRYLNGAFEFTIIGNDELRWWLTITPCNTTVFASFALSDGIRAYLIENDEKSFIIVFRKDAKHAFKRIQLMWLPSQIASALESAYNEFTSLPATSAENTTPLVMRLGGNSNETFLIPNDLIEAVKRNVPETWIELYRAVEHHEITADNGDHITIVNDVDRMTITERKKSGEVDVFEVETISDSVLFPYLTPRGYILVVSTAETYPQYCICHSAEDLAAAIADPTGRKLYRCMINRPFSGSPIKFSPVGVPSILMDAIPSRPIAETLYSNRGIRPIDVAFNQYSQKPLCVLPSPAKAVRIDGQYIDVSTATVFTARHTMRVLGINLIDVSHSSFSVGQVTIPIARRSIEFVDMFTSYMYGPISSTFADAPAFEPPAHDYVNTQLLLSVGNIVVAYTVFRERNLITMVAGITNTEDKRQFEPEQIDCSQSTTQKIHSASGIISMYYYGNTLVLVFEDRIEIYLKLSIIDDAFENTIRDTQRKLYNYYVEFAGMYLALRCRERIGPPIYVFATGELSYSMPLLNIALNETIISHAPARVTKIEGISAIEWLSDRPSSTAVPMSNTSIFRHVAAFL